MVFRHMNAATILLAVVATALSCFASEKSDVEAAVHLYFENVKQQESPAVLAMCDSQIFILDAIPPHAWHGHNACAERSRGLLEYDQKNGFTDRAAKVGAPAVLDVTGAGAYFVAPMTYTYRKQESSIKESGYITVALRRTKAGWRITAWAYSMQAASAVL